MYPLPSDGAPASITSGNPQSISQHLSYSLCLSLSSYSMKHSTCLLAVLYQWGDMWQSILSTLYSILSKEPKGNVLWVPMCDMCLWLYIMSGPRYASGGGIGSRFQEQPPGEHRFLSDDEAFGSGSCSLCSMYSPLDWCSSAPCRWMLCICHCVLLVLSHQVAKLAKPCLTSSNGRQKTLWHTKIPITHDYKDSNFKLHKK